MNSESSGKAKSLSPLQQYQKEDEERRKVNNAPPAVLLNQRLAAGSSRKDINKERSPPGGKDYQLRRVPQLNPESVVPVMKDYNRYER